MKENPANIKLPVTSASISNHCSPIPVPVCVDLVRFPPPIISVAKCAFPVQGTGKTIEMEREKQQKRYIR